jgi:hypothetical protein
MLSKRVVVVAGDKGLQKRLVAGAMAAGGAVQAFAGADELPARVDAHLILYALGGSTDDPGFRGLLDRLAPESRVIPLLPAPQLEGMVRLLSHDRVASVLTAEELSAQTVSSAVSKLFYGDLFGLEKVMPWGVRIYSTLVGDYQEKSLAISIIGDFAAAMGVRRKYREQIDQCIDEMLMNALYDAPVDDRGTPLFAEVAVKDRVLLKVEEKAVVQYACDGERFAVAVRDSFGSLSKKTVLAYLDKCLHAGSDQIDRKAGGAGLGLYLIANSTSGIWFHIFGGRATELVATFDLSAPRPQLRSFGIVEETLVTASRPGVPSASGIRTLPIQGRRREDLVASPTRSQPLPIVALGFALALLTIAVGLAAAPYLHKPAHATLHVESDPPGASLFVDGRARGATPLDVDDLEAGHSYAVRASLKGHQDDDRLVVAHAGTSTLMLHLAAQPGTVVLETDPPGAHVLVDNQDTGRLAPTTVELAPGTTAQITLRKDGFRDQKLSVTAPLAGERTVYRATLPLSQQVAGLTIAAEPPTATVSVDGMALLPPAPLHDTFVQPRTQHHVKVTAPGYIDFREDLTLGSGEHKTLHVRLQLGGVLALKTNVSAHVLVDGKPIGTTPLAPLALAVGEHALELRGDAPYLRWSTKLAIEKGKTVEQRVEFGTVEVKAPGVTAVPEHGDTAGVTVLALPVGTQKLGLSNASGEKKEQEVVVAPGGRVVIDHF